MNKNILNKIKVIIIMKFITKKMKMKKYMKAKEKIKFQRIIKK